MTSSPHHISWQDVVFPHRPLIQTEWMEVGPVEEVDQQVITYVVNSAHTVHTYLLTHTYVCTHTHGHTGTHTYCTYTHTYTHTRTRTHTHTHTHQYKRCYGYEVYTPIQCGTSQPFSLWAEHSVQYSVGSILGGRGGVE